MAAGSWALGIPHPLNRLSKVTEGEGIIRCHSPVALAGDKRVCPGCARGLADAHAVFQQPRDCPLLQARLVLALVEPSVLKGNLRRSLWMHKTSVSASFGCCSYWERGSGGQAADSCPVTQLPSKAQQCSVFLLGTDFSLTFSFAPLFCSSPSPKWGHLLTCLW